MTQHYRTKSASHAWRKARMLAAEQQQPLHPCCIRPDAAATMRGTLFIVLERLPSARWYCVYSQTKKSEERDD